MAPLNSAHQGKKSSANLAEVGLNGNRAVHIASSKYFEPKRFVGRLNKVEGKVYSRTTIKLIPLLQP